MHREGRGASAILIERRAVWTMKSERCISCKVCMLPGELKWYMYGKVPWAGVEVG